VLPDVFAVHFAPADERPVVVRRQDTERPPAELPPAARQGRNRHGELAIGAAEESVELCARVEQVEVHVADSGKRERDRDIRIDDHASRERADAISAGRDNRWHYGNRRPWLDRLTPQVSITLRGVPEHDRA
jgi:hypothetical protein